MSDRFYAPESYDEPTITLTGSEAHHMHNVIKGCGQYPLDIQLPVFIGFAYKWMSREI
jgi:hypothetical protein